MNGHTAGRISSCSGVRISGHQGKFFGDGRFLCRGKISTGVDWIAMILVYLKMLRQFAGFDINSGGWLPKRVPKKRMTVGHVTFYQVNDLKRDNAAAFFVEQALSQQGLTVLPINPLASKVGLVTRAAVKWQKLWSGKGPRLDFHPDLLRGWGRQILAHSNYHKCDILLASNPRPISFLQTPKPIVLHVDTGFAGLVNFLPNYSGLTRRVIAQGHQAERQAQERATAIVYTCRRSVDLARHAYQTPLEKFRIIERAAGFSFTLSEDEIAAAIEARRKNGTCTLLFTGYDWERKGGPLAVKIALRLNQTGTPAKLVIIGAQPKLSPVEQAVCELVGPINKSDDNQLAKMKRCFLEAHFLILPTKADITPIVMSEGAFFGLPTVASDIFGIPDVVADNVSGKLFPVGTSAHLYADWIAGASRDKDRYRELALAARRIYNERLNQQSVGRRLAEILRQVKAGTFGKSSS